MTCDLCRLLPPPGVLADPYQDPHDVYLMLLLVFRDGIAQMLCLLPPAQRTLPYLVARNRRSDFWGTTLHTMAMTWFHQNAVDLDAAMYRAYQRAVDYTLRNCGVPEPVIL